MLSPEWTPGPLDVLHDPGDQHVLAVADRVDLDLAALQVLVDQDRAACARSAAAAT